MKSTKVTIGEQHFVCEVVSTDETRAHGLMEREQLERNHGMLFDFQEESLTSFWMKNTLIPLDIVWLDAEKTVIEVQTATPCVEDPCETFQVKTPTRWVLEVNAGTFLGKIGDTVEFDL